MKINIVKKIMLLIFSCTLLPVALSTRYVLLKEKKRN